MATARISPIPSRYWVVPIARAVIAFVVAVLITFTSVHSATFGLLVFGVFALVTGVILIALGARTITDDVTRWLFRAHGAVGVLAGGLALLLATSGLGFLLYVVSVWAALTGFIELYCGLRGRTSNPAARDWLAVGGFTAILSVVFLLIPADSVLAVGLVGAYAVIVGVYLAIGGLTLKSGAAHRVDDGGTTAMTGS